MNFITSYCQLDDNQFSVNGEQLLENDSTSSWMRTLYDYLKLDYPKFHKMDLMSKVGTIGIEILKERNEKIVQYADDEIALIFANRNSSANTDMKFQKSYKEKEAPSPSLFVYTLPNILMGEIAIKNKWYGENIFTVSEEFDADFFENYCNILIPDKAKACVCGWINVLDNKIDAFLFTVEKAVKSHDNLILTPNNLLNLRKA